MPEENNKTLVLIDKFIFGLVILFLLSLTNSIFVNQLGYYGALLLILVRYFLTRKNQFRKTGLEIFFAAFLAAELLSAVFSNEHGHAFTNFTRRLLLIPTLYTIAVAADDAKKAKLFFKVFIGASLISIIIYLISSYQYFIYNLYQIEESGPSLFQYPITTSEIMSFTVIFLFAFLLNEKQSFKYKLLTTIFLFISLLALLSTYKRTGWIGTAAGMFAIILLKRNWKLILPIVAVFVVLIFVEKNKSEVYIFNMGDSKTEQIAKFNTQGRAYDVFSDDNGVYLSDFENGMLKVKGEKILNKVQLPGPVQSIEKWKNNLLASLIDTRFIVMAKDSTGKLQPSKEFLSSGFTVSFRIANDYLYIMDKDSGLTVFKDPNNVKEKIRIPEICSIEPFFVDSAKLFFYDRDKQAIAQYSLENGLPAGIPKFVKLDIIPGSIFYSSKQLVVSAKDGLRLYKYGSQEPELLDKRSDIKNVFSITRSENKLLISDLNKNIYLMDFPANNQIKIANQLKLGFVPKSSTLAGSDLYVTNVRRSRITSIFDPYIPSNFNRIALWRAGMLMLKDHPVFGVGDIDLNNLYRHYKRNYDKELQGHLHNNYVHFLAILGLFGFLTVLALLGKIILLDLKIYNSLKDKPFASSYALGAFGGFIAFLVAGLTEWNFGDHEVITLVWFTLGLNLAFYFLYGQKKSGEPANYETSKEAVIK